MRSRESTPIHDARRHRVWLCAIGYSGIAALAFYFVETRLATWDALWLGWSARGWAESAIPLGIYFGYFFVVTLILGWVLHRASRRSIGVVLACAVSGTIATGSVVVMCYAIIEGDVRVNVLYAAGIAVPLIVIAALIERLRGVSPVFSLSVVILAVASACGLVQILAMTTTTEFDPEGAARQWPLYVLAGLSLAGLALGGGRAWSRPQRAAIVLLVLLAAAAIPTAVYAKAGGFSAHERDKPNLLFISVDTLRADYTSAYGGPVSTPSMERIAARGTRFDRHYSLAPWTSPSVNSMWASKYPPSLTPNKTKDEHRTQIGRYSLSGRYWTGESKTTIAQRFGNAGYATGAVVGNPGMVRDRYLLDTFGHERVMDGNRTRSDYSGPLAKTVLMRTALEELDPELVPMRPFDSTGLLTRQAQQFLRFRGKGPFFLWVHYFDPHAPFDPPRRYRETYKCGPYDFSPPNATEEHTAHREYLRSLYESEIRYVDAQIGRLLDTVEALGVDANTYIVLWADHGEEFWDHNKLGHGQSLYDELLRVPLIVAGPDVLNGGRIDTAISSIDLVPTLADLLGVEPIPGWRGVSLAGILRGSADNAAASPVYAQGTGTVGSDEPLQAVVRGRLKLIRGMESGNLEMYDYVADPGETQNLVQLNPDIARLLATELNRWGTTFPVTFEELGSPDPESTPSDENLEVLEALGYL